MDVPFLTFTYYYTDVDWSYKSKPDGKTCLGYKNEVCSIPRGKVLGGTSNFNFMIHARGNKKDFDRWEAEGCTGWGYRHVLKYFKKLEDMRVQEVLNYSPGYHSVGGYQKFEDFYDDGEFHDYIGEGMEELGYPLQPDLNGAFQTGYDLTQGTLDQGRRCSAAKAFLSPIKHRDNLKVSKKSLVTKVLIHNGTKTAYGVEFLNEYGKKIIVKAKKEVIVSGGSINSPQILMLSGVGPKKHLEVLDISVVADLPVGENLQDHVILSGVLLSVNYSDSPVPLPETITKFLLKEGSRFSNIPNIARTGWFSTVTPLDYPNCLFATLVLPKNESSSEYGWILPLSNLQDRFFEQIMQLNLEYDLVFPACFFMSSFSKGKIELKSTNPKNPPEYITGYFSDSRDIEMMLPFYDFIEELVKTEGLKSINASMHETRIPECEEFEIGSREYRNCSLRYIGMSGQHQTSTCKMGPVSSRETVVDPELRVKGIKGLRVIDCSIMPHVTRANTNTPALMIAEKCSDLIKEAWLGRQPVEAEFTPPEIVFFKPNFFFQYYPFLFNRDFY